MGRFWDLSWFLLRNKVPYEVFDEFTQVIGEKHIQIKKVYLTL